MPLTIFLDTSYVIALVSPRDRHHPAAKRWAQRVRDEQVRIVTTRAVQLEIGAALSRVAFRIAAATVLDALDTDPSIEIVPVDDPLYHRALELFKSRADKGWSLTDCASFVVMADRGIAEALTADEHFNQAGFAALLLDT